MRVAELFEEFDRYKVHDLEEPKDKEVEKVDDVQKLAEKIRANCKIMLKAYQETGKVLYRGVKGDGANVIVTGIRPDRKPVQMNLSKHKALNKFFASKGLKVTRGNSIFTTAKQTVADDWGDVYAVFVKDGWTAQVYDKCINTYSFYTMRDIGEKLIALADRKKTAKDKNSGELQRKWAQEDVEKWPGEIDGMLKRLGPREFSDDAADLMTILRKQYHEALIVGDSYIGVRRKSPMFKELLKELDITS
jgi:hypothetical protein